MPAAAPPPPPSNTAPTVLTSVAGVAPTVSESTFLSTANSLFVVPYVASMNETGSGTYSTTAVEQQTVVISGIDRVFNWGCSLADSIKLMGAFVCVDSSGEALTVGSGSLDVSMNDINALTEVLVTAINGAVDSSNKTAAAYLTANLSTELTTLLASSFFTNLGSADANTIKGQVSLDSVDLALDASGGAANMAENLAGDHGWCDDIYTQIPLSTLDKYLAGGAVGDSASDEPSTTDLPLLKGDTLVFVFDVAANGSVTLNKAGNTANIPVPGSQPSAQAANAAGNAGATVTQTQSNADYNPMFNINYTPDNCRIAFQLTVGDGVSQPLQGGPSTYEPGAGAAGNAFTVAAGHMSA